ncbi:MAG TPA: GPW/gp25 family protein [Candidatus Binatia bacterium]|nr:GPW/gp25 family protein [Candidatus Binatia bacterium]
MVAYPFAIDAGLGILAEEPSYEQHVDQLMKQVLLTAPGERIDRVEFGCGLRRMLFAPNNEVAASLTQITVYESINRWLGDLVSVNNVTVLANDDKLDVTVVYTLRVLGTQHYLNISVGP